MSPIVQLCSCGALVERKPCDDCRCKQQRRTNTTKRGLGADHQHMARLAIRAQTWCSDCGHTGTPDNPLTGDHVVPRSEGGRNIPSNYRVLCRSCNSSRGPRPK